MQITVEKFRVIVKNETPDYINASYVKVSEYDYLIMWQENLFRNKERLYVIRTHMYMFGEKLCSY